MKFYLREIDIDKNLSGSAESLSISSSASIQQSTKDDKSSKQGEEFSASFVAQTNWTFVEKLLKVSWMMPPKVQSDLIRLISLLRSARRKPNEC